MSAASPTVAVFDSGFGGLTVLRALVPALPGARFVYLGDTARLPYGSKSRETIVRYALSSAQFLLEQGADLLVVACNTASALALGELQAALPIPVIGMIQPGAQAALAATAESATGGVLVLATAATVQSHAYAEACAALGLHAVERACPLLVPLVEENWLDDPEKAAVTREALRIYLSEALTAAPDIHTLLLGCTHYPLLTALFHEVLAELDHPMRVVDSAQAVAEVVRLRLGADVLQQADIALPPCRFFATDSVEKFERLGSRFLGQPVTGVRLVDLGG